MHHPPKLEPITSETLLNRVQGLQASGSRLVQISATRLPEVVELTYTFDLAGQLSHLRLLLSGSSPQVPSISSIFACAMLYENELHDLFQVQVNGMAVDFGGNLYKTAVKFPFAKVKAPPSKPASAVQPTSRAVALPSSAPL